MELRSVLERKTAVNGRARLSRPGLCALLLWGLVWPSWTGAAWSQEQQQDKPQEEPLSHLRTISDEVGAAAHPAQEVMVLNFSDHPEQVSRPGMLFAGSLFPMKKVRFQYYHEGGAPDLKFKDESGQEVSKPALFLMSLIFNTGSEPALVRLTQAGAGPNGNYFLAGHGNNMAFLRATCADRAAYLTLQPGEVRCVSSYDLPYLKVVSHTQDMTVMRGSGVRFALCAVGDRNDAPSYNLLSKAEDVHARGVYSVAQEKVRRSWYAVSAPPEDEKAPNFYGGEAYVALGAVRQSNLVEGPQLKGDYGVVYDLELDLVNPSAEAKGVELLFNPRGGKAAAGFVGEWRASSLGAPSGAGKTASRKAQEVVAEGVILADAGQDGGSNRLQWEVFPPVDAYQTTPLAKFILAPATVCHLRLLSMPEGASNYPVRLLLRPWSVKSEP